MSNDTITKTTVTFIPGDGIGPEIAQAIETIFQAAKVPVQFEMHDAGLASIEKTGNGLPSETLDAVVRNAVALKGPTTTPIAGGHKSVNVTIRKTLELYANVRPVKSLPGLDSRYGDVDLIIVRENVEDTYAGIEHYQTPDVAQCLKVISRAGCEAIVRKAFEVARSWGRKRVTCVHKANIHKLTDGLFLSVFKEIAAEYTDIQSDEMLVDNACMQLVMRPQQFDVMVTLNLYGDILSDLCAGLVGGLGVAPGSNIGDGCAVFEAVHGSAPDIAGKGLANPTALLQSAIMMLRYMNLGVYANQIENAMIKTLSNGVKTKDLGGQADTKIYTDAICANLVPVSETVLANVPVASPRQASTAKGEWKCVGMDIFVNAEGLPAMPEAVGPYKLKLISNRGTKVFPGPLPKTHLVNCHRCRYIADGNQTNTDSVNLLTEVSTRYEWVHVEKLFELDGVSMYTKAQGE
jgi:NAD-dependent isocitrate dehydrogenase